MTTPDNYKYTGKIERLLDGIQRKVTCMGSDIKAMSERVTELVNTTDSIYAVVTYQHDSPGYRLGRDDFLDDFEE